MVACYYLTRNVVEFNQHYLLKVDYYRHNHIRNKVECQGGVSMANEEIRKKAKTNRIPQWRLAFEMGISEATLTRWFRVEMSEERKQQINDAMDRIMKGG